jgi:hypothetical protein
MNNSTFESGYMEGYVDARDDIFKNPDKLPQFFIDKVLDMVRQRDGELE